MKDGEQLIPCEYDSISSWWEYGPSAHYVVKDKKVGIIDYIGKVLLPTEYDSLDYVTKDVVIVTKDSKYGAVDINNRLVLPFEYDDIRFDIITIVGTKPQDASLEHIIDAFNPLLAMNGNH
mgnify:FL=1